MRGYLASPTGFSPEMKEYRERVKTKLRSLGHEVVDPWDLDYITLFKDVDGLKYAERLAYNRWAGDFIGRANHEGIQSCDFVIGILDGTEPDSGTVGEVCFGAGIGKVAFGLRTDVRDSGDMPGIPIHLQVMYFIDASGGRLFRSVDDIAIPLTFPWLAGKVTA